MNAMLKPKPELFLMPGQIWFGGGDFRLRTILGASLVITFWQPLRRVGGMCHVRQDPSATVGSSLDELLVAMTDADTPPADCDIRLFGGGRMFASLDGRRHDNHVQRQSIERLRGQIHATGAEIGQEHLGGNGHRQLLFDIVSGDTWLRHWPLIEPAPRPANHQLVTAGRPAG